MPLYLWTSIEPEQHDKDIEGGATKATKDTKDTKDALPRLESEKGHNPIDPPTETLHHEERASNVDRWATSPGIVQRRERRKALTSSITMNMTSRSIFHPLPSRETT